jgi:hypothetical protein
VRSSNLANKCQSDAAPLPLGREEWHEYPFALIRRNAGTIVCDHDGHTTLRITMGGQADATVGGVAERFDCVPDQIDEGLIQQLDVGSYFERFGLDAYRQTNVAGRQVIREAAQIALKFRHVHAAIVLHRRRDRILFDPSVRPACPGHECEATKRAIYCVDLFQFGVCHRPCAAGLCILDSRGLPGACWSTAHSASYRAKYDIRLIDDPVPLSFPG